MREVTLTRRGLRCGRTRRIAVALIVGLFAWSSPCSWAADNRATGDWGGARTRLSDAGVDIEVDYTGESFVLDGDDSISWLGNLDVMLTFDTEKLHAWPGGTILVYGQDDHGYSNGESLKLLMPVSNFDSQNFTQLSEFWLEQQLGDHLTVRLGKQDANRDFAAPRFAGNFVNSSFGVLPGTPMPSFPAPALGVAVLTQWTQWFGIDAGVYEGDPKLESFGRHAFDEHAGAFAIGSVHLSHDLMGQHAGKLSIGGWTHTTQDRSGVYGIYDILLYMHPQDRDDHRSVQAFVRGGWSPEEPGEINSYVGGGLTAHAFLGRNNTIGIGVGHSRTDTSDETFVELFFKWRPREWFTVEPDVQVYDTVDGHNPVFAGLRVKLKL